jgi:hypothetical protein
VVDFVATEYSWNPDVLMEAAMVKIWLWYRVALTHYPDCGISFEEEEMVESAAENRRAISAAIRAFKKRKRQHG